MDYEIKMYTIETTNGTEYVAEIPELKGCIGSGDSYEEALNEVLENKKIYLETLKEMGQKIPLPKQKKSKYSGKLSLRISPRLHKKISEVSDEYGISINQLITETLAEAIGGYIKLMNISKEKMKQQEELILKENYSSRVYEQFVFSKNYIGGIH
ncbi:toxin-antitoxin system HicB family antitoxin [Clostridium sp. C1]|uniref:toxin-antitoxin system HicB family antitoxin n=1 Tax=Clostridium sp. C1 TaxID=1155388 RepID=UPI001BAB995A|nr:toxin-antitoxin system HicB family antitoxin [Clostridium sp. C1]QUN12935.1 toxin-antitoxin system HicB family antitoxin [Clostridium sp. C1]